MMRLYRAAVIHGAGSVATASSLDYEGFLKCHREALADYNEEEGDFGDPVQSTRYDGFQCQTLVRSIKLLKRGGTSRISEGILAFPTTEHVDEGRRVVVKEVDMLFAHQAHNEACFYQYVRHPSLPKYYCHYQKANGATCLVIEYADGMPLNILFSRRDPAEMAGLTARWPEVLTSGIEFLDFLHGRGLCHGDLKPENILLGSDGVHFIDFGTVALPSEPAEVPTLQYAPPERIRWGSTIETGCTARGDFYGLGLALYVMLTYEPPFSATTTQRLRQQIQAGVQVDMIETDEALKELLGGLLSVDPSHRWTADQAREWVAAHADKYGIPLPTVQARPPSDAETVGTAIPPERGGT